MKIWLLAWRLGLLGDRCPYCGKKLLEHGFRPNQHYSCSTKNCKFNLPNTAR